MQVVKDRGDLSGHGCDCGLVTAGENGTHHFLDRYGGL